MFQIRTELWYTNLPKNAEINLQSKYSLSYYCKPLIIKNNKQNILFSNKSNQLPTKMFKHKYSTLIIVNLFFFNLFF